MWYFHNFVVFVGVPGGKGGMPPQMMGGMCGMMRNPMMGGMNPQMMGGRGGSPHSIGNL